MDGLENETKGREIEGVYSYAEGVENEIISPDSKGY